VYLYTCPTFTPQTAFPITCTNLFCGTVLHVSIHHRALLSAHRHLEMLLSALYCPPGLLNRYWFNLLRHITLRDSCVVSVQFTAPYSAARQLRCFGSIYCAILRCATAALFRFNLLRHSMLRDSCVVSVQFTAPYYAARQLRCFGSIYCAILRCATAALFES
jgi:hypothetical protein